MILLADSGSTKTHWRLVYGNSIEDYYTIGINPYMQNEGQMNETLQFLKEQLDKNVDIKQLYYFGAGCGNENNVQLISIALKSLFPNTFIKVYSDITGAARAVCGKKKGLVGILGTGSNLCLYDGQDIFQYTPSLGYILGDEGSGASIGKGFVQDVLNNEVPENIFSGYIKKYGYTKQDILDNVYKKPNPNRFLAGFAEFLAAYQDQEYVDNLIKSSFRNFFLKHVCKYENYKSFSLNCIGSIAYHYQKKLKIVAGEFSVSTGVILSNPMDGLQNFYTSAM